MLEREWSASPHQVDKGQTKHHNGFSNPTLIINGEFKWAKYPDKLGGKGWSFGKSQVWEKSGFEKKKVKRLV